MNHLVEFLLGFLVLFLAFEDSEEIQPYSWVSHVCSRGTYETAYTSYQTYRTRYQDYNAKCGIWGWGRCKRTRSWRSYYYESRTTSVYKTYYYCCSGWRQSGRYCSIPICRSGCFYGRCTSPNRCSCDSGWRGSRCQYDVNECSRSHHGCSQVCINTPGSYKCGCRKGYVLEGSKSCKDIDECATKNGQCDHICENTHGSYKCRCLLGYELLLDGRTCRLASAGELDFPVKLVPKPTVTYRNDSSSRVELVCSFDFPAWNNVSYFIGWYTNLINSVKNETWCIAEEGERTSNHSSCTRRQSVVTLFQHFAIGDTVSCKLYMKFSTSPKYNWTASEQESDQFYVGIEVSPRITDINCKVKKNVTVTLRPTVPILSPLGLVGIDSVVVSVLIPQERKVFVDKCSVELRTEDINRGKTITISGICDEQEGNTNTSHSYLFHFKPETSSPDWFSGVYEMPSMQLFAAENGISEFEKCGLLFRRISTFDSREIQWNSSGFFVFYSNEAKKVQVDIRLLQRDNQTYSACGVAIRDRDNVIVFSVCDDIFFGNVESSRLRFIKRSPGKLSKGIQVQMLRHLFLPWGYVRRFGHVILSSGMVIAVIEIVSNNRIEISVIITNLGYDKGRVSGLCGNYNNDPTDDFWQGGDGRVVQTEEDFMETWRISEDKSFFKALPPQEDETEQQEKFCFCSMKNEVQMKKDCQSTKTHFAKLNENEWRLMAQNFRLIGGSSDCKQNPLSSLCKN
ncbi:von Willebrand factor D and EGF domain-containing protein-like [Actinia tenebrosa]|uniref:von Willebrand factor D and EGF domain-containing protein-like n=1 Tax=Actinia tenebrosa TaxID=6105 RepID=A0A6P8IV76_ACTTE|nr:von Willebrand factor D and EGF domain-containing protein-like [Actinia tenebrosa]XP_031570869.1 von Willebrand factor D and EGF domain-containing protein-like [Actinia tenebrosa]XP_031570870.1 von Willebrand factor D and EGF domain-containing protein-like [Actinia tenebrosa]